jgi:hypothetical protein
VRRCAPSKSAQASSSSNNSNRNSDAIFIAALIANVGECAVNASIVQQQVG